jgi:hypothetical protein
MEALIASMFRSTEELEKAHKEMFNKKLDEKTKRDIEKKLKESKS